MSVLLFRLRNVPDDEADDIRELLTTNKIDFYETSAGNWGISTAAIWLKNNDDLKHARDLIEQYQQERGTTQQQAYIQLKDAGRHKTLLDSFKENPIRFIAYIILIGFILYVSTKPFLSLGN